MKRFTVAATIISVVVLWGVVSMESDGQLPRLAAQQPKPKVIQLPRGRIEEDLSLIGDFEVAARQDDDCQSGSDDQHKNHNHDHHHAQHEAEITQLQLQQMRNEELLHRVKLFAEPEVVALIAVDRSLEMMELDDAADFLAELQKDIKSPVVARYVRMKLAEVSRELDDSKAVKAQLRQLILMQ